MNATIRRDAEKYILCMRCVLDCASGVWKNIDGAPAVTDPDLCNRCSHCVAVCPTNTIENDRLNADQVRRVRRKQINPEGYKEIVLSRRSIRHYKKKPVEREVIEEIINLARYSPTASNSQHVSYIVVTDKNVLKQISSMVFSVAVKAYEASTTASGRFLFKGLKFSPAINTMLQKYIDPMADYIALTKSGRDLILHHAPVLILIHGPALSFFGSANCNIAATNITNFAHSLGLGTCHIGFVTLLSRFNKKICRLVNLPKGRKIHACLVLGYPAFSHPNTASRKAPEISWITSA